MRTYAFSAGFMRNHSKDSHDVESTARDSEVSGQPIRERLHE
jgi:hypothetical protein